MVGGTLMGVLRYPISVLEYQKRIVSVLKVCNFIFANTNILIRKELLQLHCLAVM